MAKAEDIEFQIKMYEKLVQEKPDFIEALIALGDLYTQKGEYQKGLEMDLKLAHLRPDDATIFYNLACDYSLLNDLDRALVSFKQAVSCGYDNFSYLEKDEDLINLRKDNRFLEYLAQIKNPKSTK